MSKSKRTGVKGGPVGHGNPPKDGVIKPGEVRNPKGRPKGSQSLRRDFEEISAAEMDVSEQGVPRRRTTQQVVLMRLAQLATAGKPRAMDRYFHLAEKYGEVRDAEAKAEADRRGMAQYAETDGESLRPWVVLIVPKVLQRAADIRRAGGASLGLADYHRCITQLVMEDILRALARSETDEDES